MKISPMTWGSSRWKRAGSYRLAAILLGLAPLLVIEVVLRICGLGQSDWQDDPFVGFSGTRPLFELNETGDRYEIARSRRSHFVLDSFSAQKPAAEYRVFCIGDSTAQGSPWSIETSFTTWLEISLTAADSSRRWEVVNCGGISYASYRMVPVLQEVLQYQPDLVVLHCSHNEFLEARSYETLQRTPRLIWRLQSQIAQVRLFNAILAGMRTMTSIMQPSSESRSSRERATSLQDSRTVMTAEVQALLDYRGGLELYHRDPTWHHGVVAHYESNLRRMASLAGQAGVKLILLNPACQLRDVPPFKAEHRAGLTDQQRSQWDDLWAEARANYADDPRRSIQRLREALAIDDQHAGLHYDLAKCCDALGQFSEARSEYLQAKELDVCPLRILTSMNDILREVGRDTGTPVLELPILFDRLSRNGIPGNDWFADHVHPTIPGYQRIADELADELRRQGVLRPGPEWLAKKEQRYREHFESLPAIYFLAAQERLDSLMLWAHGRATQAPVTPQQATP